MSKEIVVNEIHKQARRNYPRRHVIMKDIDDLWQADLIDMQSVSKENSNYNYILAVIDTFSKYAWTYPIKRKTQECICNAFQDLFRKGRIPKNLQTDLGTEFYNKKMQTLLERYNINHYSTYSIKKASIVERFIKTLKGKLYKHFSLKGNYKWKDNIGLLTLTKTYNNTKHRTIGLKPNQVNDKNKTYILQMYKKKWLERVPNTGARYKVGDFVRISKYKGAFEKGYTPNWSTEIFTITEARNTSPVTYFIKDVRNRPILGSFYSEELQKTKHPNIYLVEKVIKKKGTKLFVKWLGLPPEENAWIDKSHVV